VTAVAFAVAAAAGGVLRHVVNRLGLAWRGTLAINVVGSLALGLLLGSGPNESVRVVVGTGLLGAFTTFSAFGLEATEGSPRERAVVVVASVVLGVGAAAAGWALAA
jgi:CrcB protein